MRPLAAALCLVCAAPAAAQTIDTLALRAHTRFLASDLLEGRGAGTSGERLAAEYIAAQLERMAALPAADSGYFQPVPLMRATPENGATTLTLSGPRTHTYAHARDFLWNTGGRDAFRDFTGRLLVAGHPDSAAAALRESGSLDGRVLVVTAPLGGAALELVPDWVARGAEGVLVLVPDTTRFDLFVRSRGPSRFYVDAALSDPVWQPDLPVLLAGPTLSGAILARVPASAARAVLLPLTASVNARVQRESVPTANVAGVIPGSDPARRHEFVVYTAHYDHIGISTPIDGDSIYNGFSDNAAGVAMLLAIGEAFAAQPPQRSVLLLFPAAEERGLLGASFAAAHPIIPLERIAGLINLDAGAPPAPPISWRIAGGASSPLESLVREVAARSGWQLELTPAAPNSDYWPFFARGVPSLFIIPGNRWQGVSDSEHAVLRARWDRYHHPDDEWSPDFPFAGLQRYAEFALALGRAIADQP